jgi:hypothetical protein
MNTKKFKTWLKFILRNFFPLFKRLFKLVFRFSKLEIESAFEIKVEQENFNFSNVRVIKLESVLSVFAIRINELIIPVFKDGDYKITLPLKTNRNQIDITLFGIRNKSIIKIEKSENVYLGVKNEKPKLKKIANLKNTFQTIQVQLKKPELSQIVEPKEITQPLIVFQPISISIKSFQVVSTEIKLKENLLDLDFQKFKEIYTKN